jgi:hypothetical protein
MFTFAHYCVQLTLNKMGKDWKFFQQVIAYENVMDIENFGELNYC